MVRLATQRLAKRQRLAERSMRARRLREQQAKSKLQSQLRLEQQQLEKFKKDVSKNISEIQPLVSFKIDQAKILAGDKEYINKVNAEAAARTALLNKGRSAGIMLENFLNNPEFKVERNPNGTLKKISSNPRTYTISKSDKRKELGTYIPHELFFDSNGNIKSQIKRTDATIFQDRESKSRTVYDKEVLGYSDNKLSGGFVNRRVRLGGNIKEGIEWSIEREKDIAADPKGIVRITKRDLTGLFGSRTREVLANKKALEKVIVDAGVEGKITVSQLRANPKALARLIKKIESKKEDETTRLLRLTGQLDKLTPDEIKRIKQKKELSNKAIEKVSEKLGKFPTTTSERSKARELFDPEGKLTGGQFSALLDRVESFRLFKDKKKITNPKQLERVTEQLRRRITKVKLTTPEKSRAREIFDPTGILTGGQFNALMDTLNFYGGRNISKAIRLKKELDLFEKRGADNLKKELRAGREAVFTQIVGKDEKGRLVKSLPGIGISLQEIKRRGIFNLDMFIKKLNPLAFENYVKEVENSKGNELTYYNSKTGIFTIRRVNPIKGTVTYISINKDTGQTWKLTDVPLGLAKPIEDIANLLRLSPIEVRKLKKETIETNGLNIAKAIWNFATPLGKVIWELIGGKGIEAIYNFRKEPHITKTDLVEMAAIFHVAHKKGKISPSEQKKLDSIRSRIGHDPADLLKNKDVQWLMGVVALAIVAPELVALRSFRGVKIGARFLRGLGLATTAGLEGAAVYFAYDEGKKYLFNPTPENFWKALLFGLPGIKVVKQTAGLFKAKTFPTIRNHEDAIEVLEYAKDLEKINLKKLQIEQVPKREIVLAKDRIEALKNEIKIINKKVRDDRSVQSRDYSKIVTQKEMDKLIGKQITLFHTTGISNYKKLLANTVIKLAKNEKELLAFAKRLQKKVIIPKKIRNLPIKNDVEKIIFKVFKRERVVVGGATAMNLQVSRRFRRSTADVDGKISRGAERILNSIKSKLNKKFGKNLYEVKESKVHKGTFKLIDTRTGKPIVDLTNFDLAKIGVVRTPNGILIEDSFSLFWGKVKAILKPERFDIKGELDVRDIIALVDGKVSTKDFITKYKAPRNALEVVKKAKEMGPDRKKALEDGMYWSVFQYFSGYGKAALQQKFETNFFKYVFDAIFGKDKYTILRMRNVKVKRYPAEINRKVTKARAKGLTKDKAFKLRREVQKWANEHPDTPLFGGRTFVLGVGEAEIPFVKGSRILFDLNKIPDVTFDKEMNKMIPLVDVWIESQPRTKVREKNVFARIKKAYGKDTLQQLKLRALGGEDLTISKGVVRVVAKTQRVTDKQGRILFKILRKQARKLSSTLNKELGKIDVQIKPGVTVQVKFKKQFLDRVNKIVEIIKLLGGSVKSPYRTLALKIRNLPTLRKGVKLVRVSGETLSETNKKVVVGLIRTSENIGIKFRVVKDKAKVRISEISRPARATINKNLRLIKRLITQAKDTADVKHRVLRLINQINNTLGKYNLKLKDVKIGVKKIIKVKVARPIRKVKRVVKVSGEKISNVNSKVINSIQTKLGNVGLRVVFTKVRIKQKINNLTSPMIRSVNIRVLKIKRLARISKGVITKPINVLVSQINNILNKANLKIRLIFTKAKVVKIKKIRKITKPIRKAVRITVTGINKSTKNFVRRTENTLGNLNIRIKFAKFKAKENLLNITSSVQRQINLKILRAKRRIRLGKESLQSIITPLETSMNKLLKKFNYKVNLGIRTIKKVVGIGAKSVQRELGNIGIKTKFVKLRVTEGFGTLTAPTRRRINVLILKLRKQIRISKGKITKPIRQTLSKLNNELNKINVKLQIVSIKLKPKIVRVKAKIKRKITKPIRVIKVSVRKQTRTILNRINIMRTSLNKFGVRVRFAKADLLKKINTLSEPQLRKLNRNLRLIRRPFIEAKGKLTPPIKRILKEIKALIPIEIKIVKIKKKVVTPEEKFKKIRRKKARKVVKKELRKAKKKFERVKEVSERKIQIGKRRKLREARGRRPKVPRRRRVTKRVRKPVRPRPRVRKSTRVREPIRPRPRVRKPTRVREPIRPRPRVRKPTRRREPVRPRVPPLPPPPPPPIIPDEDKFKPSQGFQVFVKKLGRKKEFVLVNSRVYSQSHANNLGAYIANNFPIASYDARPTKKSINSKFKKRTSIKLFRRPKKGSKLPVSAKVEKKKFRINTAGEKAGITLQGLRKLRSQKSILTLVKKKIKKKAKKKKSKKKRKKKSKKKRKKKTNSKNRNTKRGK